MPHEITSHDPGPGRIAPSEASRLTSRATMISVGIAVILTLAKAIVWTMSGSVSLLTSLADSALDLTASLTVFFAVRYAAVPADSEHRFGHGKAEAFASVMQAVLVAVSAALLLREGIAHIYDPKEIEATSWALGVMGLSILLTLILLAVQTHTLKKTGSIAIEGDRAHYLSDLAANVAVIVGIGGSAYLGLLWIDGAAAILVSIWLGYTAWGVAKNALNQLMDHELPDAVRAQITSLAKADPRILDLHQLRTRASGPLVHIQFHVDMNPELTLADAHSIIVECERRVLTAFPAADILIHADPHGEAESHGTAFFTGEKEAHSNT